ncbi:hypothetical protein KEM48_013025 [Puccinia striiformis f. sp. tritici PST-130]|nr:hypothetical protein KEM48_013025 [Puccinia striiformis f. sp. tritici PST-130]
MALAYWILCRCKECAKLSYFKADGEKVIGREWNRNSSTYKRHTQTHAAKPPASRPDAHDRGALSKKKHVGNRAARTVSRTARAQVPQEIRKPRPSGLSKTDPKATFWTGKTVSCDSASGSEQDDSEDSAMADLEDSACVEEETAGKGEQQADQLDELLGALQSFRFDSDSEPAPELQSSSSESDAPRDQSFPDNEIPSELNPLGAKFFSKDNYLKVLREVNTQFTLPSKSVGQFSQAMKATDIDFSKLKYNPKKLETLDLKTHEQLLRCFKQKFNRPAALCTSFYKSQNSDENVILVPRLVHQQKAITIGHMNYTIFDQHVGNSTILYRILDNDGDAQNVCGQISQIFTMQISKTKHSSHQIQLWFEVIRFKNLTPADQVKHQFGDWPYVRTHIVYNTKVKKDYIQIDAIIGHGATWKLPKGCFGIKRNALVSHPDPLCL